MTWAQRLKRVFAIEVEKCEKCGGPVRIIASIEDPDVIKKILKHLGLDQPGDSHNRSPPAGEDSKPDRLVFYNPSGSLTNTEVPRGSRGCISMEPLCACTMRWHRFRPRP